MSRHWIAFCHSAWAQFDAWQARFDARAEDDQLVKDWADERRQPDVELGPANPVGIPGQRRGRHARPKGES